MGLEAPIGAGIETGGSECALNAELVLLGLDVISHGLQGIEIVDILDVLDLGAIGSDVLVQQILVVNQAIGFHSVRNANDLVPILEGDVLVDELLVRLSVRHVISVGLPVLIADRTVDLEQGRGFGLGDLGLQGLLVGAGSSGPDLDLDTGFLGVILGQLLPFVVGFRLEVQVIDLALAVVGAGARSASAQRAYGHRRNGDHSNCCLDSTIHQRTFLFHSCFPAPRWKTSCEIASSRFLTCTIVPHFPHFCKRKQKKPFLGRFYNRKFFSKSFIFNGFHHTIFMKPFATHPPCCTAKNAVDRKLDNLRQQKTSAVCKRCQTTDIRNSQLQVP